MSAPEPTVPSPPELPSEPQRPPEPAAAAPAPSSRYGLPRTLAWLRRFAKVWGFALFCIFVVYTFREVVLPFIFAILVAYILAPLVDRMARLRLARRAVPRGLAVIVLYVNILAVLGLAIGYFIPKLSGDFARLFREAPHLFRRVNEQWVPRAGAWVDEYLGTGVGEKVGERDEGAGRAGRPAHPEIVVQPLPDGRYKIGLDALSLQIEPAAGGRYLVGPRSAEEIEPVGEGRWERSIKQKIADLARSSEGQTRKALELGQTFVTAVITGVARLVLVLMVAAFILTDLERIRSFLRSLVPEPYRNDYDRIAAGIDRGLSGVIRGQLLICLINGLLTYLGLLLFQVKYPLLLGLIASIMSVVPIFGSILSSVPIVGIALVSSGTFDLAKGLVVLGWIILIHLIEANLLNPKIMGGATKIHPVVVVFALIAGEHSYGIVGALFAVPVASIIQTIFVYYRRREFSRLAAP